MCIKFIIIIIIIGYLLNNFITLYININQSGHLFQHYYTPVKVNPAPSTDPRILTEKRFVDQKPLTAISLHCQNSIPKDLYFYHW